VQLLHARVQPVRALDVLDPRVAPYFTAAACTRWMG
jgi:hypothetical protein